MVLECVGRTPIAELRRTRIEKARQLLVVTKLTIDDEIAIQCGFRRWKRLHEALKRITVHTPAAYRRRFSV